MKVIYLLLSLFIVSCSSVPPKKEVVELSYFITKSGLADEIKVIDSTSDEFRLPAIRSIKKWRFQSRQERSAPQYVKLQFTKINRYN